MADQREIESSLEERINDYLSSLKSSDCTLVSTDPSDDDTLDEYLLEKAAQELRVAQASLEKLRRTLSKD